MRLRPRAWIEAVAKWARRWSDRVLGAPLDARPRSSGPPEHWLDWIRRKRPQLLAGLSSGGPLFRSRHPGEAFYRTRHAGDAGPLVVSLSRPIDHRPVTQWSTDIASKRRTSDGSDAAGERGETDRATMPRELRPHLGALRGRRKDGVAQPRWTTPMAIEPESPRLIFFARASSSPSPVEDASWPVSNRRESAWRWPGRPSRHDDANLEMFPPASPEAAPAVSWSRTLPSPEKETDYNYSRRRTPGEAPAPRYPVLLEDRVVTAADYGLGRPGSGGSEPFPPLPAAGTGGLVAFRWPEKAASGWPDLPEEDQVVSQVSIESQDREMKLELEQKGGPWSVSPSS